MKIRCSSLSMPRAGAVALVVVVGVVVEADGSLGDPAPVQATRSTTTRAAAARARLDIGAESTGAIAPPWGPRTSPRCPRSSDTMLAMSRRYDAAEIEP